MVTHKQVFHVQNAYFSIEEFEVSFAKNNWANERNIPFFIAFLLSAYQHFGLKLQVT